jgi:hypothetical protein
VDIHDDFALDAARESGGLAGVSALPFPLAPAATTGLYSIKVTPRNGPDKLEKTMQVIDAIALADAPNMCAPYPHFVCAAGLAPKAIPALIADFPDIREAGFYPAGDLTIGGRFAELMTDLESPEFSAAVGEKLGLQLVGKAKLITIRKWSAASDGRIHTDSASKIATTLVYLNESWTDTGAGRLRVLRSAGDFDDYAAEISPVAGTIFGFRRSEYSWHGHLPFVGERKVVQVTWLIDDSKVAHKTRTAKFTRWLKKLNPFSK